MSLILNNPYLNIVYKGSDLWITIQRNDGTLDLTTLTELVVWFYDTKGNKVKFSKETRTDHALLELVDNFTYMAKISKTQLNTLTCEDVKVDIFEDVTVSGDDMRVVYSGYVFKLNDSVLKYEL